MSANGAFPLSTEHCRNHALPGVRTLPNRYADNYVEHNHRGNIEDCQIVRDAQLRRINMRSFPFVDIIVG